jgi:hypothetical protein
MRTNRSAGAGIAALAALFLAAASPCGAADRASVSLLVENDSFGGTDGHYTNGLKASWLSRTDQFADFSRRLAQAIPLFPATGTRRVGFAVGQNMYTPADLTIATPQPEDRPYAGWLYGELGLVSQTAERHDALAISLGVIGPASQAENAQKFWHRTFGFTKPRGWAHQLDDEPALNLSYMHSRRYITEDTVLFGLDADLIPHVGLSLGNVFTYGAAGFTLRFGDDFKGDFSGPDRIRPSMPGAVHFEPPGGAFGWYVFAGIEGRAMVRNIFLDGNTFTDSHSVDRKFWVGDAQVGIALIFRSFRLSYTQVLRTIEFDGQDHPHNFGAISLTANF